MSAMMKIDDFLAKLAEQPVHDRTWSEAKAAVETAKLDGIAIIDVKQFIAIKNRISTQNDETCARARMLLDCIWNEYDPQD